MKIQRYDLKWTICEGEHMAKLPDGNYVLFSDHEKIVGELAEMLRESKGVHTRSQDVTMALRIHYLLKEHDL